MKLRVVSSTVQATEPFETPALPVGTHVHEYRIEQVLGMGDCGITYLARDTHRQQPMALKEFFPAELVSRTPDGRVQALGDVATAHTRFRERMRRFIDEARALANFRHPSIVRVPRYFEWQGTAWMVMEYEAGRSLNRWVSLHRPLTQQVLLSVVAPLLDALEAVHGAGFLHRDIRPENIIVRNRGTPVLLDFGTARQLCDEPELAAQRFQGQPGQQGPWTDIYAFGAVMYWMIGGRTPPNAAARANCDTLLRASALPQAAAFEPALLRAIEWAMEPDEQCRPQTVAELRSAFSARPGRAARPAIDAAPFADGPLTAFSARRNLLCTILFVDMVGYSMRPVDEQVAAKDAFKTLMARAMREVAQDSRLAIDTGDGAAICFVGDPETPLRVAMLLRKLLYENRAPRMNARIGMHIGPVRVVSDINNRANVVGDGINVAQRVMDFAQGNQVLVSSAYRDVICRMNEGATPLFRYLGPFQDKHGRAHEVHAVQDPDHVPARWPDSPPSPGTPFEPPQPRSHQAQQVAAPAVGTSTKKRERADKGALPLRIDARRLTERRFTRDELSQLEHLLCRQIGPLARVLLARELDLGHSGDALVAALADHIGPVDQRESFRRTVLREIGDVFS